MDNWNSRLRSILVSVSLLFPWLAASGSTALADFGLRYVDHTGMQIVMAWDPVPDATSYIVRRDTAPTFDTPSLVSYTIESAVTGFGDTGWPLDDWRRFRRRSNPTESPTYHLDPSLAYYYHVVAETPAGQQTSNTIGPLSVADYRRAAEVVRGVAGDLWADVVLGKPSFGENTFFKTDPYHIQYAGGVVVDKNTSRPTHIFLIDSNHNRILGLEALGECSGSSAPCTIHADCDASETCVLKPGQIAPKFVLGQPSATDYGACNMNGTMQAFPNYEAASASTLCFMHPEQISVGETAISIQAVVDDDHNLWVPDEQNHRVLMYRDPFNPANGTAAAAVWGQDNFEARDCYRGMPPRMNSLCRPNSVDIDANGNLWVSEAGPPPTSRVLRFPRDPVSGELATTADIALAGLRRSGSVRVSWQGDVYVSDVNGLGVFRNPQPGIENSREILAFIATDPDYFGAGQMAFDATDPNHLWVQISPTTETLYDLAARRALKKVHSASMRAIDVSQAGDLFTVDAWAAAGLYRLAPSEVPGAQTPGDPAFLNTTSGSLDALAFVIGITTAGGQLLVSDRSHVYFWNDYRSVTQGGGITRPADGMWGAADGYHLVKSDGSGRIWVSDVTGVIRILQGPLTSDSTPVKTVSVSKYKDPTGAILPLPDSVWIGHFQPVGSGDQVWIADENHSRVVRVVNIDGAEAPGQPPYVDIVLGQGDLAAARCNKGRGTYLFARDTLCHEFDLFFDPRGNFYAQENSTGGNDGGHSRILRWDASSIPQRPSSTVFNVLPDRVYGQGEPNNFTALAPWENATFPCPANEAACPARAPAFDVDGRLVVGGANPYSGPRFPMVYLHRDQSARPQFALGDVMFM